MARATKKPAMAKKVAAAKKKAGAKKLTGAKAKKMNHGTGPRMPEIPPELQPDVHAHHHHAFKQRFDPNIALRNMKASSKAPVDPKSAVYLTTVLEYLTTELAELSCNAARERTQQRYATITQHDLKMAIDRDAELHALINLT